MSARETLSRGKTPAQPRRAPSRSDAAPSHREIVRQYLAVVKEHTKPIEEYITESKFGTRYHAGAFTSSNAASYDGYYEKAVPFEDLVFSRGDITLFGESRQQLLGADMLRIRLSLIGEGHYEGLADGGPMYFSGHSCILIDQAAGAGLSQVTESDSRHCGITLHIPRFLLTEAWGLNPAALPAFFREFEEQPRREARGLTMPLVPELTWPVLEILRCQLGGELLNLYLGGAAREIISLLLEQMKRMQDEQGQRPPPVVLHRRDLKLLHDARLLVTKNYNNPPRLSELAAAVGLNRNKLCVGFKRLFGQPVHEYCRELRLQHAIKLLREGDMPLVDIALQVGYQHAPAFSSAFKKRFGCSPKDLRRRGTILPGE